MGFFKSKRQIASDVKANTVFETHSQNADLSNLSLEEDQGEVSSTTEQSHSDLATRQETGSQRLLGLVLTHNRDLGLEFSTQGVTDSRSRKKLKAILDIESGVLTFTDDDLKDIKIHLLSDPIEVEKGWESNISFRNMRYGNTESNFYHFSINTEDFKRNPGLSQALKDICLRNLFLHGSKTVISIDVNTWEDSSNVANVASSIYRLYRCELAEMMLEGIDDATIRRLSTLTQSYYSMSEDREFLEDDREACSITANTSCQWVIALGEERLVVDAKVSLGRNGSQIYAEVSLEGESLLCKYRANIDYSHDDGTVHVGDMRPVPSWRIDAPMVEEALREAGHGINDNGLDSLHGRVLARMAIDLWTPIYSSLLTIRAASHIK